MSQIRADRVFETSTTVGAGDYALAGAPLSYRAFSAVCAIGDTVDYFAEGVDALGALTGVWETGLGTYSATSNLTRTTVYASSNAGSAVVWASGTKRVALTVAAATLNALTGVSAQLAAAVVRTQTLLLKSIV